MRPTSPLDEDDLPPLPMLPHLWAAIACRLRLAPREKEIVELILRQQQYKEIAQRLGIKTSTVQTYLQRVYHRHHLADQQALILRILAESHGLSPAQQ